MNHNHSIPKWEQLTHARAHFTAPFGELVVAAIDSAALYSRDREEISRLATMALTQILRRTETPLIPESWPITHAAAPETWSPQFTERDSR